MIQEKQVRNDLWEETPRKPQHAKGAMKTEVAGFFQLIEAAKPF